MPHKKENISFIKQNYSNFINSLGNINLKIFIILILDILFYYTLMQTGRFLITQIQKKSTNIDLSQNLLELSQQNAAQLLSSLRGFFFFIIISLILFVIAVIINWSIIKGIIWNLTGNNKPSLKFMKKFLLLNFIWLPIWTVIFLLIAFGIKQEAAPIFMIIAFILAIYLTNILYPLFLADNKITNIKKSLRLGFKKIHYFIIPYIIIIVFFLILSKIYSIATLGININPNVSYALIIIYIAWVRYYMIEVVDSII
ncbi:MAG: hypothetical protein QF917_04465 [Candidatus Woesearchaeota archaeon]|nr:hypothetical protein [Candidatus Woesearchaeota archaeon]|tara:strand:- start:5043 stop:5810 length:768 start_codon:yes stop_codon:yes gene_type:complete